MAEAHGVRADVAVEAVAAESDVEVGAGVRGAGKVRRRRGVSRGGLRRAARLRELALRQRGDIRGPPELRDVARADGAVAVPVRVRVVAELAERRADGALGEGGVGLVDPAVAVDVLGGQVPRLAVGVVCDAEGEGAGAADGGDALVNQRAACSVTSSIIHRAKVQHASSSLGRTRVATRPGRRASRA